MPRRSSSSSSSPEVSPRHASSRLRAGRRLRVQRRIASVAALAILVTGLGVWAWQRRQTPRSLVSHASSEFIARAEKLAQEQECDVLVIGGTPSGVAAALAAARAGAHVVLAEPRPLLGGDMTYAWINQFDVPIKGIHSTHSPIDYGIFGEFYRDLGLAFPPEQARALIQSKLAAQPRIQVLTGAKVEHLNLEDGRLKSVLFGVKGGWLRVSAPAIVDATNDADIAAKAGSGFYLGREQANPDRAMQAAGLFFKLKGVDWEKVRKYTRKRRSLPLKLALAQKPTILKSSDARLRGGRIVITLGGGIGPYAWERGDIIKPYRPHGQNIKVMSINFGRTSPDECVLNTLNILGTNGLTRFSRDRARREAVQELKFLVPFLQKKMPGMEQAELAGAAPELYIRETRHISGLTTLSAEDVKSARLFPDRIALCAYSMDLHPYKNGERPSGTRRWVFTLPLKSLLPKQVDGLFVASRSLSASWMAAGAARVIPVTMAAGEAAGLCAAMCADQNVSPHEFVADEARVTELQETLRKNGVDIGDNAPALAEAAKPKIGGV
jgi:hypothetical protein